MKPEISDVIIPLFSFLPLGNFGKSNKIAFVNMLCAMRLRLLMSIDCCKLVVANLNNYCISGKSFNMC